MDGFSQLGAVVRSWNAACASLEPTSNDKESEMHWSRLLDSETMMFFGYVAKSEEKTGDKIILQTMIVETFIKSEKPTSKEKEASRRATLRASFKRRADALSFFKLIDRPDLGKNVAAFKLNAVGKSHLDSFNHAFNAETGK